MRTFKICQINVGTYAAFYDISFFVNLMVFSCSFFNNDFIWWSKTVFVRVICQEELSDEVPRDI